jgi:hypothetical protein
MRDMRLKDYNHYLQTTYSNSFERRVAYVSLIDKYRKTHKTKPWFPSRNQEFIDGKPLWEHVFAHKYNGRIKIDAIEDEYDHEIYNIKASRSSVRNKHIKQAYTKIEKLYNEALQSAHLDPRLAPLVVKKRPSWINVPAHILAILNRAGNVAFSKPSVIAAVTAATAAAVPDLVPYMNEISPLVLDRMVFMGSTVAPALAYIWKIWRTKVTTAQKNRIQRLKEKHAELEAMRSDRAMKNENVGLNRSIMKLEKEIQNELTIAFRKVYTQAVNNPGNF